MKLLYKSHQLNKYRLLNTTADDNDVIQYGIEMRRYYTIPLDRPISYLPMGLFDCILGHIAIYK